MTRLERLIYALLVLGGAVTSKACGQHLVMDSTVGVFLRDVAKDSIEHVVCIYGHTVPDTVFLERVSIPVQRPIGTHNVTASDCWAALAHYHTHPVPKDSSAIEYLYYSLSDEHAFTESSNAMLALVGTPLAWCAWSRQQVRLGLVMNLTPLPPVQGQCIRFP